MVSTLPRHTLAALSLTLVTVCKLALLFLLLEARLLQPYVGDNAANVYLPTADRILATGTYNDSHTLMPSSQAPGYSVFLALAKLVAPHRYLSLVVCLQMLLDLGIALLLLALGHRVTSIEAGWWAGVLWLLFPPAVVISTWITSETFFTALLVLSMVVWIWSLSQQGKVGLSFAAGLALGVATLVRGTTLLLPPFLFALCYLRGISRCKLKCTLLLIGMCLVILPWTLRNLHVLGEPIIVQTGLGSVFLQGSRSEYFTIEGKRRAYPELFRAAAEEGLAEPTDGKATSRDRWRFALGLRNYRIRLAQEPWSLFPFAARKFGRLWYGTETGLSYKHLVLGFCSLLVVPLGTRQLWLLKRDHLYLSVTLSLLILYFVALHLVCYPECRYMLPVYPFFMFGVGHTIYLVLRPLRSEQGG